MIDPAVLCASRLPMNPSRLLTRRTTCSNHVPVSANITLLGQGYVTPTSSFLHTILSLLHEASLFANPVASYILTSAGNIPVDRKAKDRRQLFGGTFKTLASAEAVAVFPEGTSYTEPRIVQVKDGASWAALEYAKWARENPDKVRPGAESARIVTAAIVYTNKTKYRSNVRRPRPPRAAPR